MRANSYVYVFGGVGAEPEVGIVERRITPNRLAVRVRGVVIAVARCYVERMKPAERRAYRAARRGN